MRKKTPGSRRPACSSPEPEPMDDEDEGLAETRLLCPTLTVMITKTIKALCEVNIRFDKKLEVSGCLHVRSDGEKVLTCLIDEETTRIKQEIPSTERHEPIVSMLKNTWNTALQNATKSPNLASLPDLDAPNDEIVNENSLQDQKSSYLEVDVVNQPSSDSLEESIRIAVENSRNASLATAESANNMQKLLGQVGFFNSPSSEINKDPSPVMMLGTSALNCNTNLQNRDLLLGLLPDKNLPGLMKGLNSSSASESDLTEAEKPTNFSLKKEPQETNGCIVSLDSPSSRSITPAPIDVTVSIQQPLTITPHYTIVPVPTPAEQTTPIQSTQAEPTPTSVLSTSNKNMPTVDNIPYETMEVVNPKGGRTKKFQCMFCGIMLSTKGYLKNHINAVHTKARVYPCDICERLFYSAGALRIHKLRHHWANSKKHKCHRCKDAFLLPIELRRHLLKKHNITTEPNSPANNHDDNSNTDLIHNNNTYNTNNNNNNNNSNNSQEEENSIIGRAFQGADDSVSASPLRNLMVSSGLITPEMFALKIDANTTVEAQMKAAQDAAQAHIQMVQDMALISQQTCMENNKQSTGAIQQQV